MDKDFTSYFCQEDVQMTNEHMERCSISSVIKETQIKTTMRNHFTYTRMSTIKQARYTRCRTLELTYSWCDFRIVLQLCKTWTAP